MAVKVKVTAPQFKSIGSKLSSDRVQGIIANEVIKLMKQFIAIGTSPVLGERRFTAYKDKTKYPGDKKNSKPVNLFLSGDMLDAITYRVLKSGVKIGIFDSDERAKATTHIRGLNGVPQRKFLPVDDGDKFIVSIQRSIRTLYARLISDIINK